MSKSNKPRLSDVERVQFIVKITEEQREILTAKVKEVGHGVKSGNLIQSIIDSTLV
jgi:hypothetical protein